MILLKRIKISLTCLILFSGLYGKILPPSNIRIIYSEKSLDITWDSVPGTTGYNIYTSSKANTSKAYKKKINKNLITSGTHFTYIWHFEKGEKVRKIKGYEHHLAITSVFSINGKTRESRLSEEIDNCYFEGFSKITSRSAIQKISTDKQKTSFLPVGKHNNRRKTFIQFMEGPGKELHRLIKKLIDPKETGGCAPVSTILIKLLENYGLHAYRIDGNFIKEFHIFVIIKIEKVEYILDFTADQFIPNVTPVMIPRDFCHLNEKGKLALTGTPIYSAAKIYTADQIELSNKKSADIYRTIFNKVKSAYK